MDINNPSSIPDLDSLCSLVMRSPTGKLRFNEKAKALLGPRFKAHGFDINRVSTVQQYQAIQEIVSERIACKLAHIMDEEGIEQIDIGNLEGHIEDLRIKQTSTNVERAPTQVPSQAGALRLVENRSETDSAQE